jgi:hypothetical protein
MALQNAGRPATARPVNEPPLSCANVKIPLNYPGTQDQRRRRQRLVEHVHRLGPSPLGHFKIDPEFVRALGGDRFAPSLHVVDGGGR